MSLSQSHLQLEFPVKLMSFICEHQAVLSQSSEQRYAA